MSLFCLSQAEESVQIEPTATQAQNELFTIKGKVNAGVDSLDLSSTRVIVDDGAHVGFLHADGSFSIPGLSSNSYVVEISSPRQVYEPIRVDINSKGKIRARRLNLIEPSDVKVVRYPLNFESRGQPNYFFKREQFRVMDVLMSPMVIMMVLPLVLVVLLPKLVNQDPELQKELQQQQANLLQPNANMPSISEMFYNMVEGGNKKKPQKKIEGSRKK